MYCPLLLYQGTGTGKPAGKTPASKASCHKCDTMQVGFQKDSKWMYSGSEDGTVKLWDMRAPGFQREYASRGAVNTVVLHPNQGELVSGASVKTHCARC